MTYPQFIWGLSNGVTVLVFAGLFWFGLGGAFSSNRAFFPWPAIFIIVAFSGLLFAAAQLRRKARGFGIAELRHATDQQRAETANIVRGFRLTNVGQAILIGMSFYLCSRFGRMELAWPFVGLIVSLHFLPLARIFRVRTYYLTAVMGSLVSLFAIGGFSGHRLMVVGLGMGVVLWASASYLVWTAERAARYALGHPVSEPTPA